jgi:hypothetical protein
VKVGGASVEDVYLGNAADFGGPTATPLQRQLDADGLKALGEPVNILHMAAWDSAMAIKPGIEKANSIDPKAVAKVPPTLTARRRWVAERSMAIPSRCWCRSSSRRSRTPDRGD